MKPAAVRKRAMRDALSAEEKAAMDSRRREYKRAWAARREFKKLELQSVEMCHNGFHYMIQDYKLYRHVMSSVPVPPSKKYKIEVSCKCKSAGDDAVASLHYHTLLRLHKEHNDHSHISRFLELPSTDKKSRVVRVKCPVHMANLVHYLHCEMPQNVRFRARKTPGERPRTYHSHYEIETPNPQWIHGERYRCVRHMNIFKSHPDVVHIQPKCECTGHTMWSKENIEARRASGIDVDIGGCDFTDSELEAAALEANGF